MYTVKDVRYREYFGFANAEVKQMLAYYEFTSQYDGYLFGNTSIYCLWDVINYCGDLRDGSVAKPQNYWVNTSSNDIIRTFLNKANGTIRNEIERLVSFCMAFQENNIGTIEDGFNAYLKKTISIRDINTRKETEENFYHGILLGILGNMDGWNVKSNAESCEGYCDIREVEDEEIGIIIKLKYVEKATFDDAYQKALQGGV